MDRLKTYAFPEMSFRLSEDDPIRPRFVPRYIRCDPRLDQIRKKKEAARAKVWEHPKNPHFLEKYQKHRERVECSFPKVDSKPPEVVKSHYYDVARYNQRLVEYVRIERENAKLLHNIAAILNGSCRKGMFTCHDKHQMGSIPRSGRPRHLKETEIAFDNLKLYQRINRVKSSYETRECLNWYRKQEDIMENMTSFPLYWKSSCGSPGVEQVTDDPNGFHPERGDKYVNGELIRGTLPSNTTTWTAISSDPNRPLTLDRKSQGISDSKSQNPAPHSGTSSKWSGRSRSAPEGQATSAGSLKDSDQSGGFETKLEETPKYSKEPETGVKNKSRHSFHLAQGPESLAPGWRDVKSGIPNYSQTMRSRGPTRSRSTKMVTTPKYSRARTSSLKTASIQSQRRSSLPQGEPFSTAGSHKSLGGRSSLRSTPIQIPDSPQKFDNPPETNGGMLGTTMNEEIPLTYYATDVEDTQSLTTSPVPRSSTSDSAYTVSSSAPGPASKFSHDSSGSGFEYANSSFLRERSTPLVPSNLPPPDTSLQVSSTMVNNYFPERISSVDYASSDRGQRFMLGNPDFSRESTSGNEIMDSPPSRAFDLEPQQPLQQSEIPQQAQPEAQPQEPMQNNEF